MTHFDYIFTGSGLSALMTAYRMCISGKFADRSILMIDSDAKTKNDRTWCFWETPNGEWDSLVTKSWKSAIFANSDVKREFVMDPYEYKMIRGIDFYEFVIEKLSKSGVVFLHEKVLGFSPSGDLVNVETETQSFSCNKLFNSIFNPELGLKQNNYPVLQQHFTGWFIKTKGDCFDPECATLMDFSIPQKGNTRFMYVLPFSKTEALIEYTLFSKDLLDPVEYEEEIELYIKDLKISEFEIIEKEFGSIPMTVYPFWKHNTRNIINIGSAGGWTKASTGYTFKNTIRKSSALVAFMSQEDDFTRFEIANRFRLYDMLLLDILANKNQLGSDIFSAMFTTGNPTLIFKFLDEETTLAEDLAVILKCPKKLFLTAFLNRLFK